MNVRLYRLSTGDAGTFGVVLFKGQYLYTGELPWRDNAQNISCIPEGQYTVDLHRSPKYGNVYHLLKVQGRTYILFHQGNFCGDRALGLRSNVQGCILLGFRRGALWGQQAVLQSRSARSHFESVLGFEPFQLEIKNVGFTV